MHAAQYPAISRFWLTAWLILLSIAASGCAKAESYPLQVATLGAASVPEGQAVPGPDAVWQETAARPLRLANGDWVRITMPALASAQPLYLVAPRRATGELALWFPDADRAAISDHYRGPLRADLSSHYHVFEIPQRLPAGMTLFLQSNGQTSNLSPELLTRDALFTRDHALYGADVALRTILVIMALVGVLVWIILRERVYLKYAAYVLAILAAFSAHDGSFYAIPALSWWGHFGYRGIWALVCLSVILLITFAREFLRPEKHAPRIDRCLQILQILFLVDALCALMFFDSWSPVLVKLTAAGYVTTVVLLLLPAVIAARRGLSQGRVFLVGFSPHAVAMLVQAAALLGLLNPVDWLYTVFLATMAFEAIAFALGLAYRALLYRRERDAALELADKDELTQAYNRRAIDRKLHGLCEMARDDELATIALLFIDLDHFKRVNDAYGHAAGDECLRQIAQLIRAELRLGDLLGRYGGEEFVVILPGSDRDDALGIAERIRKRASIATLTTGAHQMRVHLSIGITSATGPAANAREMLAHADVAMYRSKAEGRNRVTVFD